ncbi:MAG TPA: transcription initiation factor TFIIIB [Nitrosopumilaceae archaeon]|nr:transcription initiation factor TFIIIB [Nitrosopumilaceae archaeon]
MARKKIQLPNKQDLRCEEHTEVTDIDRGETFCGNCGVIFTEKLADQEHEEQYFDNRTFNSLSRTGPSISLTMHDKGLFTVMGDNKDSSGHAITGRARATFSRLRLWDKRSKSESKTRNLGAAFTLLHGLQAKLGIPDSVSEKAAYLYRRAQSMGLVKGRSTGPLIVASLYAACRESNIPRSLDDVAKAGNIRRSTISRTLRLLIRNLDLKLSQYDTSNFIFRIGNNLNLKEKIKRDATEILENSKKNGITDGKNPIAFATAAIYLACLKNEHSITQSKLSDVSGVSCVTIRNTTAIIKKILKLDL